MQVCPVHSVTTHPRLGGAFPFTPCSVPNRFPSYRADGCEDDSLLPNIIGAAVSPETAIGGPCLSSSPERLRCGTAGKVGRLELAASRAAHYRTIVLRRRTVVLRGRSPAGICRCGDPGHATDRPSRSVRWCSQPDRRPDRRSNTIFVFGMGFVGTHYYNKTINVLSHTSGFGTPP